MEKGKLAGKEVAIVALGSSIKDFVMARINSHKFDEIWGINSIGAVFHVDRTFMLDPASRFLDDTKSGSQTGIGREFLLETKGKGPIYSCCLDERVPEIQLYPLEEVITHTNYSYFNNTVAYAVAYAIYSGVSKISFFGVDYSYRHNIHMAEAGRACVEFWCSLALSKGIKVEVAPSSGLLDNNVPEDEKLYGYHRLDDPLIQRIEDGSLLIIRKSEAGPYKDKKMSPPEPVDGSVLIGRHDVKGVTYD